MAELLVVWRFRIYKRLFYSYGRRFPVMLDAAFRP
jgi:hypothetical protein